MNSFNYEYPTITCKNCFEHSEAHYIDEVKDEMVKHNLCFTCLHWFQLVWDKDNPTHVRTINERGERMHHKWYPDDPNDAGFAFKGYGGTKFKIQFDDGQIVETRNLWCQGDIPKRFYDLLPINAKFLYCRDGITWTGIEEGQI